MERPNRVLVVLLLAGVSFALSQTLVIPALPDVGIATGINTVMRTMGGSFGASIATAILAARTAGAADLPTEGAYTAAFAFLAVAGLLAFGAAPARAPA
jgi:hypothetical protein